MSQSNTPTPHNAGKFGEIAETVIMAGDPLRVKFIAENFLEDPVMYNTVRGMYGYTGTFEGKRVSVQGHGMGVPSIGIYSYELFNFYGVERIIRIGTCGAMDPDATLGSVLIVSSACTDSNYGWQYGIPFPFSPTADYGLLSAAVAQADRMGLPCQVGTVLTSDVFYDPSEKQLAMAKFGVVACEMEAYGLYINALAAGKKALTILTVTDKMTTHTGLSSEERQVGLKNMIRLALGII